MEKTPSFCEENVTKFNFWGLCNLHPLDFFFNPAVVRLTKNKVKSGILPENL